MKKIMFAAVGALLIGFLVYGITYWKKEIPTEKPGTVTATRAYEDAFGRAPACPKGDAYAFVIYFPLVDKPGKVLPLPFFTFDRQTIRKVALERLLSGNEIGPYQGKFQHPVPGLRLISVQDEQGTVTATYSKELPKAATGAGGFLTAVALTLYQFDGVQKVMVKTEDGATVTPGKDVLAVEDPSTPQLLNVVAMRDRGEKEVHEVDVFFDRPVDFHVMNIAEPSGEFFRGDVYASAFDMAAVLKPKDPSLFQQDRKVKVAWKVTDKKGRESEGTKEIAMEIKEH